MSIKELRVSIEDALESMKFDVKRFDRRMAEHAPEGWLVGGDHTDIVFDSGSVEGNDLVLTGVELTEPAQDHSAEEQKEQAKEEIYWAIRSTGDDFMSKRKPMPIKAAIGLTGTAPKFHDGKFTSAQEKANIYTALTRFIASNFDPRKFTKALYKHLSLNFGFIAHYDLGGFYHARFADPDGRMKTFESITNASQWNFNDENTSGCGDLNKAIQELVRKNKTLFVDKAKDRKVEQMLEQRKKLDEDLHKLGHKVESFTNRINAHYSK